MLTGGIPRHRTASKSRVDMLMIASEKDVAIFDLGVMIPTNYFLKQGPFTSILSDAAILKVGVNLSQLRRVLLQDNNIDIVQFHDMHTGGDSQADSEIFRDPSFDISMASQRFTSPLPRLDWETAKSKAGTIKLKDYFVHLASRPYAILQLYKLAASRSHPTTTMSQHASGRSEFGPVVIHENKYRFLYRHAQKQAPPAHGAYKYLMALATGLTRKHMKNAGFRRSSEHDIDLMAYYLYTTFDRSLLAVSMLLETWCRQEILPATRIYAAVMRHGLYLRPEDMDEVRLHVRTENPGKAELLLSPARATPTRLPTTQEVKLRPRIERRKRKASLEGSDKTKPTSASIKPSSTSRKGKSQSSIAFFKTGNRIAFKKLPIADGTEEKGKSELQMPSRRPRQLLKSPSTKHAERRASRAAASDATSTARVESGRKKKKKPKRKAASAPSDRVKITTTLSKKDKNQRPTKSVTRSKVKASKKRLKDKAPVEKVKLGEMTLEDHYNELLNDI
jgi:hypothetical protein